VNREQTQADITGNSETTPDRASKVETP